MTRENGIQGRIIRHLEARGAYVINIQGGGAGRAGIPDLHATYRGHSIWLEVKNHTGKPTPRQTYELDRIRAAGGHAHIVRTVDEAAHILNTIDQEHPHA